MRKIILLVILAGGGVACSGSQKFAGSAGGPVARDAAEFHDQGFSIKRPEGWNFSAPDKSVAPDTVVILQGPIGNSDLAPVVEVSRRNLSSMDQRRKPSAIITAVVNEIAQTFDAFEMVENPEDVQISGHPAGKLGMKFTETLPDGASSERRGRFYGIVSADQLWIVRCIGSADGSAAPAFDQIVSAFRID